MINTVGPDGSVNYVASDAPGGYSQTTTLSPVQQGIYDASNSAELGALGIANDQLGRVSGALAKPLNSPTLQTSFGNGGSIQGQIADAGGIQSSVPTGQALQSSYGNGGDIQRSIGPTDFTQDRRDVTDAVWQQAVSRLAPEYGRMGDQLQTRLANQGIGGNSAAYGNAGDMFGRQLNDAYNQAAYSAVQAGANEQNTLFGQKLAQGNFANSAQAQGNQQNLQAGDFYNNAQLNDFQRQLSAGQFANEAQGQKYGQNAQNAQFANAAQNQGFNQNASLAQFGNEAMGQQFQNDAYAQNQPINQFNSLMSSGQVSMPQGISYSPTQVANTDVLGANALSVQQQNAKYQADQQARSAALGGLFKLGSAGLSAGITKWSDERLKRDIQRVGTRPDGLGVYLFRYLWSPIVHLGVMAQEVLWVKPEAVVRMDDGYLAVNYGEL